MAEVVDVFAGGPVLEGGGGFGEFSSFDIDEEVLAFGAVDDEVEGFEFGAGEEGFFGFIDGDVGEAFFAEEVFEGGFVVDDGFGARAHGWLLLPNGPGVANAGLLGRVTVGVDMDQINMIDLAAHFRIWSRQSGDRTADIS